MSEIITLKFDVPGKTAPGYLRRQRQGLEFQEKIKGDVSPEVLDELVEYLIQYVTEPEGKEEKREALWMASEDDFMALLNALIGKPPEGEPDPTE